MRIVLLSWLFLISLFQQNFLGLDIVLVSGQCQEHQKSLLLQLKNGITFNSALSTKLVKWDQSLDCCIWGGVTCDNTTGQVIGLDLDNETISGGINISSPLLNFQFLRTLNLANNLFVSTEIPSGLHNLTGLTYLNLSNSGFAGQIPNGISLMTRLEILDLSTLYFPGTLSLNLENPKLSMLVQNLTKLTELYLDGVNISAQGYDWCQAISSSLPNLRVLSLSSCYLSGPIESSIANLRFLSVIRLSQNNLSAPVPEFFANFPNLTALRLSSCNLIGTFSDRILKVTTLQILDLSNNKLLQGSLPDFRENGSLQTLVLSSTNFSGVLPDSIGNLSMLSRIELTRCNFTGKIPDSMANLTQLVYLDFSINNFTGHIPSFQGSKKLVYIDLSYNKLFGAVPSTHFEGLFNLVYVDLRFNDFNGSIPSSLFSLPSLQKIQLSNNQFDGLLPNISDASSSKLDTLDISSNNLKGPIPVSFFDLKELNIFILSSNSLSGPIQLENFRRLSNLTTLDLSYNNLSIGTSLENSCTFPFPQISKLRLASCKLKNFPNLKNQSRLVHLDLSDNQIGGEIPNWIWNVGNEALMHLNLSRNKLVNLQEPYSIPNLSVLDLHSNQLHGNIPIPPQTAAYVDYSANLFSSSIPDDIGNNLSVAYFFSASNNNLTGTIPSSICKAAYLQVLDLSSNSLNGPIPPCLFEGSETLGVLNLGKNKLTGNISGTFPKNCGLETLDLNGNLLEGKVPESLANCKVLEVLNLGNNKINDVFPCFFESSSLRVLVLRSNLFHGGIRCQEANSSWSKLQIIDVASNNFTGNLLPNFLSWWAMRDVGDDAKLPLSHLGFEFLRLNKYYYQDTVTVTIKGLEVELVKILTIFTSIDVSNNKFVGDIPNTTGELESLRILNLSHNAFTGSIPQSFGNLTVLESLDLSVNKLTGKIPRELTGLSFLSFLNLSHNQLRGKIPTGTQIQTFDGTSFEGNKGLCGPPLTRNCHDPQIDPSLGTKSTVEDSQTSDFDWQFIFTGLGFGLGAGIVLAHLMFCNKGRHWWDEHIDKLLFMMFPTLEIIQNSDADSNLEQEEEESQNNVEESGDSEDEFEGGVFGGRYCVFCSKLDIFMKRVIHDPKCQCQNSTPLYSTGSSSSSSSSPFSSPLP